MNQSSDKPTSDAVDCSEAMEAKILDAALEVLRQALKNGIAGAIVPFGDRRLSIRIVVMADDADESSVQKTHPENQFRCQSCKGALDKDSLLICDDCCE